MKNKLGWWVDRYHPDIYRPRDGAKHSKKKPH